MMKGSLKLKKAGLFVILLCLLLQNVSVFTLVSANPPLFSDGFESGFGEWTNWYGTPSTSSTQKYEGSVSYIVNEDTDSIKRTWPEAMNKVVSVRYYDDANDTSMQVEAGAGSATVSAYMGVKTTQSATTYSYKLGNAAWASTSIPRTTAWHSFVWDFRSGTECILYLDGVEIGRTTAVKSISTLRLGDATNDGRTGTVYFDQVEVLDGLPVLEATGVTLDKSSVSIQVGETDTLAAAVLPAGTHQGVIWSSSNAGVATVSGGLITGVATGTATITATSVTNAVYTASATVHVSEAPVYPGGVKLNKYTASLPVGNTDLIAASVIPAGANQSVVWSSSDSDVVTVVDGAITAVSVGSAIIKATSSEDPNFSASCFVAVTSPQPETKDVVVQYPVPGFVKAADNYTVTINGQPVIVQKTMEGGYVHVSFAGTAHITVTVANAEEFDENWTLSPLSYEIATVQTGKVISFAIDRPMQLILQKDKYYQYDYEYADKAASDAANLADIENRISDKLFIIADPLEEAGTPRLGDPDVVSVLDFGIDNTGSVSVNEAVYAALLETSIAGKTLYFPPGIYNWEKRVVVPSHSKIYLEGGAYLFLDSDKFPVVNNKIQSGGGFFSVGGREDIRIFGRGTLHGNNHLRGDGLFFRTSAINPYGDELVEELSDNITIEGIVIAEIPGLPGGTRGSNTTVRNVKFIGSVRKHMDPVNAGYDRSEGFNFQGGSSNILVENSLIVGEDDSINFSNSIGRELPNDGLTLRNSVIMNANGGSLKATRPYGGYIRNVAYENVDAVYADRALAIGQWNEKSSGSMHDFYFKGYRVEEMRYKGASTGYTEIKNSIAPTAPSGTTVGPIYNFFLQNSEWSGIGSRLAPEYLKISGENELTMVKDIHFYNFKVNGTTITEDNKFTDGRLNPVMPFTEDITFEPNDPAIVSIEATNQYAYAAGNTGTFTITRTGDLTDAFSVGYQIRGSAVNGVDYTTISNVATIPAGQASTTITIESSVGLDTVKTVYLSLLSSGYNLDYMLAPQSEAVVTLVPDGL